MELKHLPDMVFPNNILSLEHETGAKIEFNALDALKRVSNGKINIRLPIANEWRESRYNLYSFRFLLNHQSLYSGLSVVFLLLIHYFLPLCEIC